MDDHSDRSDTVAARARRICTWRTVVAAVLVVGAVVVVHGAATARAASAAVLVRPQSPGTSAGWSPS